jgi:hypothetical protein
MILTAEQLITRVSNLKFGRTLTEMLISKSASEAATVYHGRLLILKPVQIRMENRFA